MVLSDTMSEPKCIADRILLYMRHTLDYVHDPRNARIQYEWDEHIEPFETEVRAMADEIYREYVRGDEDIINGQNPKALAAAIVYIAGICKGPGIGKVGITQKMITEALDINRNGLKRQYLRLRNMRMQFFDLPRWN